MCANIIYYISFFLFIMRVLSKTHQSSLTLKRSSKTYQSSLNLKGGSTAFPKPLFSWRRLASLGNMKANFHCAHLHNLSPQGTGDVPTALLVLFSKINPSFFTIKEGSTFFPKPLSPQGTGDVPTALLGAQTATL